MYTINDDGSIEIEPAKTATAADVIQIIQDKIAAYRGSNDNYRGFIAQNDQAIKDLEESLASIQADPKVQEVLAQSVEAVAEVTPA